MNSWVLELFQVKNGSSYEFLPNVFEVRHD